MCNKLVNKLPVIIYIQISKRFNKLNSLIKLGIHDTSFASKSPFKKTWMNSSLCIHDARNFDEYT
jgi:hypothetical protein